MRTPMIAGNWKMNPAPNGAFAADCPYRPIDGVDIAVFPTYLDIAACTAANLPTGGQYGHPDATGAHTGDISMHMLKESGCAYVLCGHSERRQDHGETNEIVAQQVQAALEASLQPVVCIGETAEQRESGQEQAIIAAQLAPLPLDASLIIAYEPVWAIGTGNTATPEMAQEMHAFIRSQLPTDKQATTRILYGGSMKPANAADLLAQPDIDGGLIGGSSLKPDEFAAIIQAALS